MNARPDVPETLAQAIKAVPVRDVVEVLPAKFIESLEQNQKIASCCRHPENHTISAWKSKPSEPAHDIFINHCTCGRSHLRLCVGETDFRPVWPGSLVACDSYEGPSIRVCQPAPFAAVRHIIPQEYYDGIEACDCAENAPEGWNVEAHKSSPAEPMADIFIFSCPSCGKTHEHRRPASEIDLRPVWNPTLKF